MFLVVTPWLSSFSLPDYSGLRFVRSVLSGSQGVPRPPHALLAPEFVSQSVSRGLHIREGDYFILADVSQQFTAF
jgi:hypothetical protein